MLNELVSADEQAAHGAFCRDLVRPLLSPPPPVIWHYTSGASLISILESGTLYSTQISCLNDHRELRHSRDLFRDAMKSQRGHWTGDAGYLADLIIDKIALDTLNTDPWFITCFSSKADDLSQWRAYGGGENGYAIGFDSQGLKQCGMKHDSFLIPVSYDTTRNQQFASALGHATVKFFLSGLSSRPGIDREVWAKAFLADWVKRISYFQPLLKDPAFEAESEWRMVHQLGVEEIAKVKYMQKSTMMSRHLPLQFPPPDQPNSRLLPISKIIVGPNRHKEVSRVSVATLLRTCGYPENGEMVKVSEIPFQAT